MMHDQMQSPVIYEPQDKNYETAGLGFLVDSEECEIEENANGSYELTLVYPTGTRFDDYFSRGYQIKAKPNDLDDYHIFDIYKSYRDMFEDRWIINAETSTNRLGNRTIRELDINKRTGIQAIKMVEYAMDLKSSIELFSDITTVSSTTFSANNVLNCVAGEDGSLLQRWGGEIKREPFRLSLLKRRGRDNVTRISYGKDLNGLKVTFDWSHVRTRIHPYLDIQNEKGEMERIWGNAVDSPIINNYPDVYSLPILFTEEQGATDLKSLNSVAETYFTSIYPGSDKPSVNCEIDILPLEDVIDNKQLKELRKIGLFDSFILFHEKYKIEMEVKIISVNYDGLLHRNNSLKAGDEKYKFYETQEYDLRETLKKQSSKTFLSVFVDYVTTIISGNDGGNVVWWPKNRPSDLFFIDTDSLETAKQVLRINKSGIGFSDQGWQGPFKTAWTLDGILTLGEGMLHLGSDKLGKFLQNTADGLEFLNTETTIGTMGTSARNFPGFPGEDTSSKALSIELKDGEFFKVQTSGDDMKATGIYIPNPRKPLEPGFGTDFVIAHMAEKGTLHIVGDRCSIALNDGKAEVRTKSGFFVDGVQISQNGGGTGGGNGSGNLGSREEYARNMITDLFNADYEKVYASYLKFGRIKAWGLANRQSFDELNEIIRGQGVSPVFFWAYESGEGYHPSLSFLNHFYVDSNLSAQQECRKTAQWVKETSKTNGQLAWYDAQYHCYTSPPDKQAIGNAYMAETKPGMIARVMLQGTAAATWAMFDPEALSGSVNGMQDYADPFEHQMAAIKSWQQPQTYVKPMKNYVVTSEFGWRESPMGGGMEFHNAIDLANGGSSPIYASGKGKVVTAGDNFFGWYGNYVVIEHPDGLYTGYAHLSQIDVVVGQEVNQGQQIGLEGATGPVTGPHLHFQFMKNYSPTNGWPTGGDADFINPREKVKL